MLKYTYKFKRLEGNLVGVAALVLGIVSTVIGAFFNFIGWIGAIVGIIGIILAAIARKNGQRGMATAGLVLSIIGTALSLILYIACISCAAGVASAF